MKNKNWKFGQKQKVADLAEMQKGTIGDVFARRRQPLYATARKIVNATDIVLGLGEVRVVDIMMSRSNK